jgi:DNA polymerase-4
MDAFYAAVEVLLNPGLAGRPVIVGGSGRRGVVAAASYEARAYGVHSAMPSVQARQLCPFAVFLTGRYDRYTEYSRLIHEILSRFTPLIEGIALDEAFLDVSGAGRLMGSGREIAEEIRRRIRDEVGLSASVGVATNKLIAKLASEEAKPRPGVHGTTPGHGVVVVEPGQELAFLHPKPVEALWGVGPATADRLHRLGVSTVGGLAQVPLTTLEAVLGPANGRQLHDLSWGRDPRRVEADRDVKSIGHEETYAYDRRARDELEREVLRMADAVGTRLRVNGVSGRTVTLKIRYADFTTITRSLTVGDSIDTGPTIARLAVSLLGQVDVSAGVRLLGVSVSHLGHGLARQLTLNLSGQGAPREGRADRRTRGPQPEQARQDEAAIAIELVRARFGDRAVGPAALLEAGGLRVKRQGDTQWGPAGDDEPDRQDSPGRRAPGPEPG